MNTSLAAQLIALGLDGLSVKDPEPGTPPGTRIDDPLPFAPIDDPVPTPSDDEDSAPDSVTTDPRRGEGIE